MDLPPDEDDPTSEGTRVVLVDDDGLIFSEAQLAESLGDPHHHQQHHEEGHPEDDQQQQHDIHHHEDLTVEGEEDVVLPMDVDDMSLLETTDEGGGEILETIVEEEEHGSQEEEQPPPLADPPVVEEEQEEEVEPPCACPTCVENQDENGVFKGVDPCAAKCIICYVTVEAPEEVRRRVEEKCKLQQQQQQEGHEDTPTATAGDTVGEEPPSILPHDDVGDVENPITTTTDTSDPSPIIGVKSEAIQEPHPLTTPTSHLIKEALLFDTPTTDTTTTTKEEQLNLQVLFQVLSCSFDDLDQDIDLLTGQHLPLCDNCQSSIMEAVSIYQEILKLESTLGGLRDSIKENVAKTFEANFCKRKKDSVEVHQGLVGQIDAARRAILGEDCPVIARLLNFKKTKKGRRSTATGRRKGKKQVVSRSALYPQVTLQSGNKKKKIKEEQASENEEEEEEEVIQTHSGRRVRKPNYKKWLLAEEDEFDEDERPGPIVPGVSIVKSEDNVEIVVVQKPPESPAKSEQEWSPGHTTSDEEFQGDDLEDDDASSSASSGSDGPSDFDEDDDDYNNEDYSDRPARKRRRRASSSGGGDRIPCPECSRTFADEDKKDRHYDRYHGPDAVDNKEGRTYPCDHCEKEFKRPNLLKRHLEKDHGIAQESIDPNEKKKHICEFCGQKYRNGSELRVHVRLHTGETPFKCDHCDQSFVSALKRETHIEQSHWEVPPLKCEFCDRAFFRQHRLRIHRITHTGERAYLCEICSQSFSHPTYLKYHQGQHAELNMESYKCKECGKQFANPTNLKLHVKTVHLKEFRFSCEVCGMGFTHMSHKRIHMRGHTGERPYKCEICGEAFRYKDRLRIHLRGHTGERPFVCEVCKKGFASRSKLKRHEKIHEKNSSGNKSQDEDGPAARPLRYTCDDCGKAFAEPQHLSAHKRYCQRKNFADKEEKVIKATKSAPPPLPSNKVVKAVAIPTVVGQQTVAIPTSTVQKIQIDAGGQTTQMLVPVTYTYPVAYGYEVQQYQVQQPAGTVSQQQQQQQVVTGAAVGSTANVVVTTTREYIPQQQQQNY